MMFYLTKCNQIVCFCFLLFLLLLTAYAYTLVEGACPTPAFWLVAAGGSMGVLPVVVVSVRGLRAQVPCVCEAPRGL